MNLKNLISSEPGPNNYKKNKKKDIEITFKVGFGENDESDDDMVINPQNKSNNRKRNQKQRFNKRNAEEFELLLEKRNKEGNQVYSHRNW
jgi:hypothetical protein